MLVSQEQLKHEQLVFKAIFALPGPPGGAISEAADNREGPGKALPARWSIRTHFTNGTPRPASTTCCSMPTFWAC